MFRVVDGRDRRVSRDVPDEDAPQRPDERPRGEEADVSDGYAPVGWTFDERDPGLLCRPVTTSNLSLISRG